MTITVTIQNPKRPEVSVTYEAEGVKGCFKGLEHLLAFTHFEPCGMCSSTNVKPDFYKTKDQGFEYYKHVCIDCEAELLVGQKKDERNLFINRTPKDVSDHKNGWHKRPKPQQQQENTQYSQPAAGSGEADF